MPIVPFITETYSHRTPNVSSSRCVNLYPEINGADSKGASRVNISLINTPGTELFADLRSFDSSADCRGLYYTSTERLFGVYGGSLLEIYADGTSELRGEITKYSTRISMVDDGDYLILVDGYSMNALNLETNLFQAVETDFENPTFVVYQNFRIVAINGTNQFYWSELNSPLNWPASNFNSAADSADPIISIAKTQGELWFFGTRTFEVRRNAPNPDNPFAKVSGSFNEIGCGAQYSVTTIGGVNFWLGSNSAGQNQIFMSSGYGAKRVSNHAIEYRLNEDAERTNDCVAFSYQESGHTFVIFTFVSANITFVYDVATDMWHERVTRDEKTNAQNRWSPIFAVYAFSRVLVGNGSKPYVLRLNLNTYEEFSEIDDSENQVFIPILRYYQSPIYWSDLRTVFHREFELDIETGVATQTGQGFDPQIMLQFSDDAGHTWSSEYWKSMGKIGQYRHKVRWRNLGRTPLRVYRIQLSDPVKCTLMGARVISQESTNR